MKANFNAREFEIDTHFKFACALFVIAIFDFAIVYHASIRLSPNTAGIYNVVAELNYLQQMYYFGNCKSIKESLDRWRKDGWMR